MSVNQAMQPTITKGDADQIVTPSEASQQNDALQPRVSINTTLVVVPPGA